MINIYCKKNVLGELCCLGIFYDTFNSKHHVMPHGMMMSLECVEESTQGLIWSIIFSICLEGHRKPQKAQSG